MTRRPRPTFPVGAAVLALALATIPAAAREEPPLTVVETADDLVSLAVPGVPTEGLAREATDRPTHRTRTGDRVGSRRR